MRKSLIGLLSVILVLAGFFPAGAQSSARVELYNMKTDGYPSFSVDFDPYDSSGNFVSGLAKDTVTVLEDNQPYPPDSLEDLQPGVRFALALDPSYFFSFRNGTATSRYNKIYGILQQWADTHPDSLGDDLSLVPTAGEISAHLSKTADFAAALEAYSPALQTIKPSLDTLAKALDTVSEAGPQPGMKATVLFISAPPNQDAVPTLQNLTQRAAGSHIRVNVWIVGSKDYFGTAGATAMKDLATQTGGQYELFSWDEPLPGLETYLAPLRHAYRLTYSSHVLSGGSHSLGVLVNTNGETLTSLPFSFNFNIQLPQPILVSPPTQIVRQAPDGRTTDPAKFMPQLQPIEMMVEFPDGRNRRLVSTALFVDNQKVAENTAPPFERFTWDLSGYTTSGQHQMVVEAVDEYGLRQSSVAFPVTITVVVPERGLLPFLSRNRLYVSGGAIIFAGAALAVILVSDRSRRRQRNAQQGRMENLDPLTQPVLRTRHGQRGKRGTPKLPKESEAYLVRIRDDGQALTAPPIPVTTPEMLFGSDPLQATRILDDPAVAPVHARLKEEKGSFILTDENSAAGTWVNYEPISGPHRLQHGDLIQMGRVTYRFMLRHAPERPAPKVLPVKR